MSTEFTLVKSSNPDVERAHLNKILRRLRELASSAAGAGSISTQPNNRLTADGVGSLFVADLTLDLVAVYTLAKE